MNAPNVDLTLARKVLAAEGKAIAALAGQIGPPFAQAVQRIRQCDGKVVLTGIGKAGIIAQKISGTLASTGTQSIYLHPVEALHGDLGRLQRSDVLIGLSHSGQTIEIIRLLDHIKRRGATLIAVTGFADSLLGKHADITITYGNVEEACPLGLAPSVSTSCMLALGDALALTVMQLRSFTPEEFAAFHPAGALGRKLLKVEEAMTFRKGEQLGLADDELPLADALAAAEKISRRTGALLLVDSAGRLSGILTDADIRRHLIDDGPDILRKPARELMTHDPKHIHLGQLASDALAIINIHRIDELPVVDSDGRPVGLVDVQDLLGLKTVTNGPD